MELRRVKEKKWWGELGVFKVLIYKMWDLGIGFHMGDGDVREAIF